MPARAQEYHEKFGVDVVSTYEEMLKSDVNCIAVFVQRHLHGPIVIKALEAGKQRCRFCEPVPESYADENAWLVWLDTRNAWHLTDQCAGIQEEATRMLFTDLADQEGILRACPLCGALQYESELPESVRSRQLDPSLITNGDTLIYFNEQDGYYHASSKCSSNVQLTYTAHKLFEAITEGKEPCPHCQPPEASFD